MEGNNNYYACHILVHNCNNIAAAACLLGSDACANGGALAAARAALAGASIGSGGTLILPAVTIAASSAAGCGVAAVACPAFAVSALNQGGGGEASVQEGFIPRDEQGRVISLPRDRHGVPVPSSDVDHTQIGGRQGRKGDY